MDSNARPGSQPCQPPILLRGGSGAAARRTGSRSPAGFKQPPLAAQPSSRKGGREAAAVLGCHALSLVLPSALTPRYLGCCSPGTLSPFQTCPGTPSPAPGMLRPGPAGWLDGANERVQALLVSGGEVPLLHLGPLLSIQTPSPGCSPGWSPGSRWGTHSTKLVPLCLSQRLPASPRGLWRWGLWRGPTAAQKSL